MAVYVHFLCSELLGKHLDQWGGGPTEVCPPVFIVACPALVTLTKTQCGNVSSVCTINDLFSMIQRLLVLQVN